MDVYQSEREQVEALKKWWKENGRMVIAGAVLGLGGVIGWTTWQSYTQTQRQQASLLYERLVTRQGPLSPELKQQAENFITERPDSGYAPLTALVLAGHAFQQGRSDEAKRHLRWTVEHADVAGLRQLARLRLARVLLDEGKPGESLALLEAGRETGDPDEFAAHFEEVRGDALLAQEERDAAREAYRRALEALPEGSATRQRVQMKLDDLGQRRYSPGEKTG